MIVDAYNNVWRGGGTSDYLTRERYTVEMMLAAMDQAGVDMAVGCSLGQMIDNAYVAEVMQAHSDRIIGFGQVNPRLPDAVEDLGRLAAAGLRGLKLHPTMHGYHFADHGLLDPIFDACRHHGLIVLVNTLDDPFCAPLAVEEISRGFPGVPVLLAHMGTVWNVAEALLVAERNDQIYLETSSTQLLEVKMAYARVGAEKIVMGSDWPGSDFVLERHKIARAIPDAADRALVEGGNLSRLLRLPRPPGEAHRGA
jgi:predicted TIM-barrel fold metal-dependent hydrolase